MTFLDFLIKKGIKMLDDKRKKILKSLMEKKLLVSPEVIDELLELEEDFLNEILKQNLTVLDHDTIELFRKNKNFNLGEFERAKTLKQKFGKEEIYNKFLEYKDEIKNKNNFEIQGYKIKVLKNYYEKASKKTVKDFVNYYVSRLKKISSMLEKRQELNNLTTIRKVREKRDRSEVSVIGLVNDKRISKNGKIILTLEDQTGEINVLISESNKELYERAKDIVLDEVIGVNGISGNKIIFVKELLQPDIPVVSEPLKAPDEVYAVFLSDFHVGSKNFLSAEVEKFIKWINSELGSDENRRIAKLSKYIFIIGDLVDGVGIYPGQSEELEIRDIYKQYSKFSNLISKIPKDKHIVIIPGNHDAVRLLEPQPPISKEFIPSLYEMPNVFLLSNPAIVNIHSSQDFQGFNVLLYHGFSFDYYVAKVDSIRNKGGYDRADLIMKFLLQRRHLAPTYSSSLFSPEYGEDPLVIDKVPQFVATGHIHKCSVSNYRATTLISGSCWQSKTSFQEKMGHHPEPARVPIVNLKTRKFKILKFT